MILILKIIASAIVVIALFIILVLIVANVFFGKYYKNFFDKDY